MSDFTELGSTGSEQNNIFDERELAECYGNRSTEDYNESK